MAYKCFFPSTQTGNNVHVFFSVHAEQKIASDLLIYPSTQMENKINSSVDVMVTHRLGPLKGWCW